MNSSVRTKPLPPGQEEDTESREEKLHRIRNQVQEGYYGKHDVMRDVADALLMNPIAFENLNEKRGSE